VHVLAHEVTLAFEVLQSCAQRDDAIHVFLCFERKAINLGRPPNQGADLGELFRRALDARVAATVQLNVHHFFFVRAFFVVFKRSHLVRDMDAVHFLTLGGDWNACAMFSLL